MRLPLFALGLIGLLFSLSAHAEIAPPQREKDFIAIVEKARKQFMMARSVDARRNARLSLQINVHEFMGLAHSADNWVGFFKVGKTSENGDRSIAIEIAPGVIIATWESSYADWGFDTMIKPYTPLAKVLDTITIGEPVMFSANLIGSVVSSDDDMVQRPRIIASFTRIRKLSDAWAP